MFPRPSPPGRPGRSRRPEASGAFRLAARRAPPAGCRRRRYLLDVPANQGRVQYGAEIFHILARRFRGLAVNDERTVVTALDAVVNLDVPLPEWRPSRSHLVFDALRQVRRDARSRFRAGSCILPFHDHNFPRVSCTAIVGFWYIAYHKPRTRQKQARGARASLPHRSCPVPRYGAGIRCPIITPQLSPSATEVNRSNDRPQRHQYESR